MAEHRVIWRWAETLAETMTVAIPRVGQILTVREGRLGDTELEVWALVDPDAKPVQRLLRVVGTGHATDPALLGRFLGTTFFRGGRFVFHVFEDALEGVAPAGWPS